ncbi:MAG: prepilin-type N-terminal cleavage/methylation domain-containing protein [Verrucomicrobiae bacterium]|nr:prepilin-type N-terminal cleavage/methylation domain-containing protein [Verrucomicrobiae bacterium]
MKSPASHPSAGFTLVELVIGAGLMSLILAAAYACLSAGLSAQRLIEPRIDAAQNARVAMDRIAADLRAACILSKEAHFLGMDRRLGDIEADNLDFATHHHTPARPGEGDYCQVSYFLQPDPESSAFTLWRRRHPAIGLDPLAGGQREVIADGLRQLKFEYYDGWEWFDTWGDPEGSGKRETSALAPTNLSGLPDAVRITLAFDAAPARRARTARSSAGPIEAPRQAASNESSSAEPPMVFQTVVRLNLARRPSSTASGSSATAAPEGSPTPSTPMF